VIDVTHKEFNLALLFFRNIGRPLSRAYIHEAIWVRETAVPSRTMDTHVSRVRNKLQLRPENGFRLVPVYSYGYRLEKLLGHERICGHPSGPNHRTPLTPPQPPAAQQNHRPARRRV
jgi:DNA-binding winged helix-turn-helix (wHTH) protein